MSWVSVAVFQTVIASNSDVMCRVTMCAGHGLYKQFTRLFLFLQKWVWLAGLTAAVPASFRFQEFKSSVIIWFWRCEVSYENGQLKWKQIVHHFQSFFTNIATKTLTTEDGCWFADCSFWSCTQQLPQNEGLQQLSSCSSRMLTYLRSFEITPVAMENASQQIQQHSRIMVIHGDSLSIAAWPEPSSPCEKCGLWDYLLVCCCKRGYNWNALV